MADLLSESDDISFIIVAPASIAACIVEEFLVSHDIGILYLESSLIIGIILFCSSFSSKRIAPGLDDSPPISIILAPSSSMLIAFDTASLVLRIFLFLLEKLSGVTFKIPII